MCTILHNPKHWYTFYKYFTTHHSTNHCPSTDRLLPSRESDKKATKSQNIASSSFYFFCYSNKLRANKKSVTETFPVFIFFNFFYFVFTLRKTFHGLWCENWKEKKKIFFSSAKLSRLYRLASRCWLWTRTNQRWEFMLLNENASW